MLLPKADSIQSSVFAFPSVTPAAAAAAAMAPMLRPKLLRNMASAMSTLTVLVLFASLVTCRLLPGSFSANGRMDGLRPVQAEGDIYSDPYDDQEIFKTAAGTLLRTDSSLDTSEADSDSRLFSARAFGSFREYIADVPEPQVVPDTSVPVVVTRQAIVSPAHASSQPSAARHVENELMADIVSKDAFEALGSVLLDQENSLKAALRRRAAQETAVGPFYKQIVVPGY